MHGEGGSSLFQRYVNCVIPNLLAIIVCACLITFCSREPLSPSMADREEEAALQSSEEKGSGQDMGVPNQVSAIQCVSIQLIILSCLTGCTTEVQSANGFTNMLMI